MKKWELELARAWVLRKLVTRNRTRNTAWDTADLGPAKASPNRSLRSPLASQRGGPLWFVALRAWQRRVR
jgi:hypothetical protein